MTRAAQEYDEGKRLFMPDWEVLLKWVDVVKMRDANSHTQRKEEAHLVISHFDAGTTSTVHLSSPHYIPKDPLEDDAEATYARNDATADAWTWLPLSPLLHSSLVC